MITSLELFASLSLTNAIHGLTGQNEFKVSAQVIGFAQVA